MGIMYVQTQGAKLTKSGGRINIKKDDKVLLSMPAMKLEGVVLFGTIKLTTPVMKYLLFKDIPVSFMTETGKFCGKMTGKLNPDYETRRKQYVLFEKEDNCIVLTKELIKAKLNNSFNLLSMYNKRRKSEVIEEMKEKIKKNIYKIENTFVLNNLRGFEGISAKYYFNAFKNIILNGEEFKGREKRGSHNPVNAMLNYSYGVLGNFINSAIEMVGLDPYNGFYHKGKYNRPSLALDIMEPFRVICDSIVIKLINKKMVDFDNFDFDNKDYVLISPKTRQLIVSEFEKKIGYKSCFIENNPVVKTIRSLKKYINEESDFIPYLMEV